MDPCSMLSKCYFCYVFRVSVTPVIRIGNEERACRWTSCQWYSVVGRCSFDRTPVSNVSRDTCLIVCLIAIHLAISVPLMGCSLILLSNLSRVGDVGSPRVKPSLPPIMVACALFHRVVIAQTSMIKGKNSWKKRILPFFRFEQIDWLSLPSGSKAESIEDPSQECPFQHPWNRIQKDETHRKHPFYFFVSQLRSKPKSDGKSHGPVGNPMPRGTPRSRFSQGRIGSPDPTPSPQMHPKRVVAPTPPTK